MSAKGWHTLRDGDAVTVCRQLPPRFDVMAETTLPAGRALRYAHQIRQDMWRALQGMRGFSPVVQLEPTQGGWTVRAGGRLPGPTHVAHHKIATLLNTATLRSRWIRFAQKGQGAT